MLQMAVSRHCNFVLGIGLIFHFSKYLILFYWKKIWKILLIYCMVVYCRLIMISNSGVFDDNSVIFFRYTKKQKKKKKKKKENRLWVLIGSAPSMCF